MTTQNYSLIPQWKKHPSAEARKTKRSARVSDDSDSDDVAKKEELKLKLGAEQTTRVTCCVWRQARMDWTFSWAAT